MRERQRERADRVLEALNKDEGGVPRVPVG
jgi:hypothetical protein